jgi:hypothetical protein
MLKHYRLAVDDDGFYNIICKGLEIKKYVFGIGEKT